MRIRAIAACTLALGALGLPTAVADPTGTLPPMTPTAGGPIIGGGGAAPQMLQQLKSLNDPNVQEVDGPDAAQFIAAAAGISDRDLALPFMALQRALVCQKNNAGFGARGYRRNDGKWGGAMLVIAKSAYPDTAAMKACEMSNWRRPSMGISGKPSILTAVLQRLMVMLLMAMLRKMGVRSDTGSVQFSKKLVKEIIYNSFPQEWLG